MASINLYVNIEINKHDENNYIILNEIVHEDDIEQSYYDKMEQYKKYEWVKKIETFEGYLNQFILLRNIKYDGRKRKVTKTDIKKALIDQGYAIYGTTHIFGITCYPTEKLLSILEYQLNKRKKLIKEDKYILLKEIV